MDDSKLGIQEKRASSTLDYRKIGSFLPTRASCPPGTGGYDGSNHANARFMMSFMVDARGRTMQGFRHGGFRIVIPPGRVNMPSRVSCRMIKKEKLGHRLPIMENEALACRILEMGPSGTTFNGMVIVEVPHIASMTGKDRELVVLRSDDGRTWKEHNTWNDAETNGFGDLESREVLAKKNIVRIVTGDFPRFFAIISRLRLDISNIGAEGGLLRSKVDPRIQAVIPEGALTKTIKVGLQAQLVDTKMVNDMYGKRVNAVSPIVSVERRRRMFHKPICLKIPIPKTRQSGTVKAFSPTLRLMCSIAGGMEDSEWQDTEAQLDTFLGDSVCFTTSLSARYWLIDCQNPNEAEDIAAELYEKMPKVPLRTSFTVAGAKVKAGIETSHLRISCGTGDRPEIFFGCITAFSEVAKSGSIEVFDGETLNVEVDGNLGVLGAVAAQTLTFHPFQENRLEMDIRLLDPLDPSGKILIRRMDGSSAFSAMDVVLPKHQEEQPRENNVPVIAVSNEEPTNLEDQHTEEDCCVDEQREENSCADQLKEGTCCKDQQKEENVCEEQQNAENCDRDEHKLEDIAEKQENGDPAFESNTEDGNQDR